MKKESIQVKNIKKDIELENETLKKFGWGSAQYKLYTDEKGKYILDSGRQKIIGIRNIQEKIRSTMINDKRRKELSDQKRYNQNRKKSSPLSDLRSQIKDYNDQLSKHTNSEVYERAKLTLIKKKGETPILKVGQYMDLKGIKEIQDFVKSVKDDWKYI